MVELQQFSSGSFPFMRKFIVFAAIAMDMYANNIPLGIVAAARKWNNMINFIFAQQWFITPVAFVFLTTILIDDILFSESASCLQFPGTAFLLRHSLDKSTFCALPIGFSSFQFGPWISSIFLASMSIALLFVPFIIRFGLLAISLSISMFISDLYSALLLRIFVSPNLTNARGTSFATRINTVFAFVVFYKLIEGSVFAAVSANSENSHRILVNALASCLRQVDTSVYFSGATLDASPILPRGR